MSAVTVLWLPGGPGCPSSRSGPPPGPVPFNEVAPTRPLLHWPVQKAVVPAASCPVCPLPLEPGGSSHVECASPRHHRWARSLPLSPLPPLEAGGAHGASSARAGRTRVTHRGQVSRRQSEKHLAAGKAQRESGRKTIENSRGTDVRGNGKRGVGAWAMGRWASGRGSAVDVGAARVGSRHGRWLGAGTLWAGPRELSRLSCTPGPWPGAVMENATNPLPSAAHCPLRPQLECVRPPGVSGART